MRDGVETDLCVYTLGIVLVKLPAYFSKLTKANPLPAKSPHRPPLSTPHSFGSPPKMCQRFWRLSFYLLNNIFLFKCLWISSTPSHTIMICLQL